MDTLRYIKLHNNGLFVAQILVEYKERHEDGEGNVSFAAEWRNWQSSGDRNILQFNERSVDLLSDSDIPDGSIVRLHPYIAAGYSDAATEQFIYSKTSPSQAVYEISGTTLSNQLRLVSYRLTVGEPLNPGKGSEEGPSSDPGDLKGPDKDSERPDGFTYRDIMFVGTGAFATYKIVITNVREDLGFRYGVASYDMRTGMATDIPGQGWRDPEDGRVEFPIVFGASFIVTSDGTVDAKAVTPAERFNAGRGVKAVAPGSDQYYIMRPEIASAVSRVGNAIVIKRTSVTRQYTLIDLSTGFPAFMWMDGNGGDLAFDFAAFPSHPLTVVTREKDYNAHIILPVRPEIIPGADPAHSVVGFDERTGQGLLTVDVTEGFAYAITDGAGRLLGRGEREFWSVTADTEQELTVTANPLGFYEAPALGKNIRFRVPPGGTYRVLTRLDDGTVVRSEALVTPSVGRNVTVGDNRRDGRPKTLVKIDPVSIFAEYATVDKRTGEANKYIAPAFDDDFLQIETNIPKEQVEVIARPRPFPSPFPIPFPAEPFPPVFSEPEASESGAVPGPDGSVTKVSDDPDSGAHGDDALSAPLPVIRRVTAGDVRRAANEVTVTGAAADQEYALHVPDAANPGSAWMKPEDGRVDFLGINGKVRVVTRKSFDGPLPGMTVQADGAEA